MELFTIHIIWRQLKKKWSSFPFRAYLYIICDICESLESI